MHLPARLAAFLRRGWPVENTAGHFNACDPPQAVLGLGRRLDSRRLLTPTEATAMTEPIEHRRWSVDVFQDLDHEHQQTILEAFRHLDKELVALGTQSGHYYFVIVETGLLSDRIYAWQTVRQLDIHARKSYSFRPPQYTGLLHTPAAPAG